MKEQKTAVHQGYEGIHADFVLIVSDDSMTGDGILPGNLVFVRARSTLDNGDIALVDYNGEARIGRYWKVDGFETLVPSNRGYMTIVEKELCIIGKAVAIFRDLEAGAQNSQKAGE